MRNEKGYFCSVRGLFIVYEHEVWFGPKTHEHPGMENQSFENVVSNGLKFFSTEEDAKCALEEIKSKRHLPDISIGNIEIIIAETKEEVDQLRQEESIVILNSTDLGTDMIGPNTSDYEKSTIYPIDGELLTVNDGIPFSTFPEWIYYHTGRQGGKVTAGVLVSLKK